MNFNYRQKFDNGSDIGHLGDISPPPQGKIFVHFRIEDLLGNIAPMGNIPPPHTHTYIHTQCEKKIVHFRIIIGQLWTTML